MNYLSHSQNDGSLSSSMIIRSTQLCWLLSAEESTNFEHKVQPLITTCLSGVHS